MTQELTKVQKMHIWLFEEGSIGVCTSDIAGRALECVMNGESDMLLTQKQWRALLSHPAVVSSVNGYVVSEVTEYTVAYLSFYGMKFYCLKDK